MSGGIEAGGKGNGGGKPKKPGGGFWDVMRKIGAGIVDGMSVGFSSGGAAGANGSMSARRDPVATNERPAAARQIHRSMKAWRDREAENENDEDATKAPNEEAAATSNADGADSETQSEAKTEAKSEVQTDAGALADGKDEGAEAQAEGEEEKIEPAGTEKADGEASKDEAANEGGDEEEKPVSVAAKLKGVHRKVFRTTADGSGGKVFRAAKQEWGIPPGCESCADRKKKGGKLPEYAEDNPDFYYFDPKAGKYNRKEGFPTPPAKGHKIPCFVARTLVATPNGPVPIETLRPGDLVFAMSLPSLTRTVRKVISNSTSRAQRIYEVETEGGAVRATSQHQFFRGAGDWAPAKTLSEGDWLRRSNGDQIFLKKKRSWRDAIVDTFNIEVEEDHNYFVGSDEVLVHNGGGAFCIYLGKSGLTGPTIYVGQTEQDLMARQAQHRAEAKADKSKSWKAKLTLSYAAGPAGALVGLSHDEGHYWERKTYDANGGAALKNEISPYNDASMQALMKTYCP